MNDNDDIFLDLTHPLPVRQPKRKKEERKEEKEEEVAIPEMLMTPPSSASVFPPLEEAEGPDVIMKSSPSKGSFSSPSKGSPSKAFPSSSSSTSSAASSASSPASASAFPHGPPGGMAIAEESPPDLLRNMSTMSRQVLSKVKSRHAGVSYAKVARLLLKTAAILRQGLLSKDECERLHRHLEDGDVDLVHAIVSTVGCRPEPSLPLEDGEAVWDCAVCFETQEEQGWHCPSGHRYCGECMRQHVESMAFPRCPTMKCGYELTEADLKDLRVPAKRLEAFRSAKLQGAVDVLGKPASDAKLGDEVIRCPNPACQNAVLVPHGVRLRYECICHAEPFCTACRQSPYHYHSACGDVQQHRHRWLDWVSGGREKYFGLATASRVYEGQALAVREGMQRHAELEADEKWKEKKCRECPNCARPVQKLDGCDSMVCGTDAHGGNQQPGCGTSFQWSQAKHYVAKLAYSKPLPAITTEDVRCRGHSTMHAFSDCSLCGIRGIRGPRFRCLHCPSFDVCKDCEVNLFTLHESSHVFEIMFESDFAWGGVRLPTKTRVRAIRRGERLPYDLQLVEMKSLEGLCGTISSAPPAYKKEELPKTYEWQTDKGRWVPYTADANAKIVDAAQKGQYAVQVQSSGHGYMIDLRTMFQMNQRTGGRRPIRATVSPAAAREAEQRARAIAAAAAADPYRIMLDDGREVVLAAEHLEPILESRAEAEKLMARALQEQEDGVPPEPVAPPEEEEPEDDEEGGDY